MSKPLLERLSSIDKMTTSEKKLAVFFEKLHTGLAFENLSSISEKVGVGKSTVTRFVIRLGYTDFYSFIRELKDEAASSLDTPAKRYASTKSQHEHKQPSNHLHAVQENLRQTLEQLNTKDFNRTVKLLADSSRPLYLVGSATAEPLMHYFYLLLSYLRDNVVLLDGNAPMMAHRTGRIDKKTVLFSLAFNRYPKLTGAVMEFFSKQGAEVIFMTDRHTSPMLGQASTKLIVHAEGEGMFKTRCSAMAVLEALIFEIANQVDQDIPKRYEEKNKFMRHLDIYTNY